ncbi:MAG: YncE family protein [Acidiferrobacterales bacterium]
MRNKKSKDHPYSQQRVALSTARAALLLVVLLSSTSCISNRMYRPDNIQKEADYSLAYVEFDDQGELWAPPQVPRAVKLIEEAGRAESGGFFVVFVHGWRNNASEKHEQKEGRSLHGFKQFLSLIVRETRKNNPTSPPPVVGVFVAWRGDSAHQPLKGFTFYGRRRAANRIAGATAVTDVITRLTKAANENPKSKAMLVGHSFGGLILERALSQVTVRELHRVVTGPVDLPYDLVVLLNPASPSLLAKQMVETLARERLKLYQVDANGNRYDRPLLLSITSRADTATRRYYPIGSSLGSLGSRFRDYGTEYCSLGASQRSFYMFTPGHNTVLHSHLVTAEPLAEGATPAEGVLISLDPATGRRLLSFDVGGHRFTMRRKARAFNDTPYWIMNVPSSLISGHSDIFTPQNIRLLDVIAQFTGLTARDATTVIVRETGLRPVGLTADARGGLIYADRSRQFYKIPNGSTRLDFLACFPPDLDPADAIGMLASKEGAVLFSSAAVKRKYETSMLQFRPAELVAQPFKPVRFATSERFQAATADVSGRKVYLAKQNELYVADVSGLSEPATVSLLSRIDTAKQLDYLAFDTTQQRLLALDTKGGQLYIVDTQADARQPRLAASGLGWPTEIKVHPRSEALYVADVKGKQIWRLSCDVNACTKPVVFSRSDAFRAPRGVDITTEGVIWVTDHAAHSLFAIGSDGTIRQSISSFD